MSMQFANKISLWILITFIDYCSRLSFKAPLQHTKRERLPTSPCTHISRTSLHANQP